MKHEGMPTQRLEEKRVEECVGEGDREGVRGRERERAHTRGREREKVLRLLLSHLFFLPLGLPSANWAQPGVLFVLPEVFTLVLGPTSLSFNHRHFGLLFPILPT